MARPFIKWAGGKSQSLQYLKPLIPEDFKTYYEIFTGGGALFFSLTPKKAVLSDSNGDLINAYKEVRDNLSDLMALLSGYPNEKEFFLEKRAENPMLLTKTEAAARFIYLNKTCFNGLYRVNRKNQFNTPFGNYKNPNICATDVLTLASQALQDVELIASDFKKVISMPSSGDFVYFDPPYVPVDATSFTSYTKSDFKLDDHEVLLRTFKLLTNQGVKCILSNSDVPWVRDSYKDFEIQSLQIRRNINSKGDGRGKVGEVLIKNY